MRNLPPASAKLSHELPRFQTVEAVSHVGYCEYEAC